MSAPADLLPSEAARLLSKMERDPSDVTLAEVRTFLARVADPLSVETLIAAMDSIKRVASTADRDIRAADIGFDMGVAAAQDFIRSRLRASSRGTP